MIAPRLTWKLFEAYGGRKKSGMLSVMVNARTDEIFPVPKKIEHVKFTASLLEVKVDNIEANPEIASHMISSNIVVENEVVVEVFTGRCGLQFMKPPVRHDPDDLRKVHG